MLATHQKVDWLVVQNEYVTSNIGYRPLATKNKVSFSTLKARAIREKWVQARKDYHNNVSQMVQKKVAESASNAYSSQIIMLQESVDNLARIAAGMIQEILAIQKSGDESIPLEDKKRKTPRVKAGEFKMLTSAMKDMATITRDLFGLPGVIKQHQMDIANEKLAMERDKISSDAGDNEITICFADPEVEEASR